MKKLCVIGSLNMDLVASVDRFPMPGESIIGKEFNTCPGGKGANQAIALGLLGANVWMVGKLGSDPYGKEYLKILKESQVKTDCIGIEDSATTGIALIEVDNMGENHIVVILGANNKLDKEFINQKLNLILECDIFLLQLEIPLDTVVYVLELLKKNNKIAILDPAPAKVLSDNIYIDLDYITPNRTELEILTGHKITGSQDIVTAALSLINKGARTVIVKSGQDGAYIIRKGQSMHIKGFPVNSIDTTGAGDSFNAGFAFALANNEKLEDCVRFANAVGALSTTKGGAQGAMPDLKQVQTFMGDYRQF